MISERLSDDIHPQIKNLNMVIPILMCFYSLASNWSVASRIKPHKGVYHPIKYDVKLFPTGYIVANFDVIQSDVALQKQVR